MVVKQVQGQGTQMETQEALGLKRNVAEYLAATEFSLAVNRKTSTLHGERLWTNMVLHERNGMVQN